MPYSLKVRKRIQKEVAKTPATEIEPILTPTTTTPVNRFAPLTNFNTYDVDQANKNAMIALGADPRMFAADGGRIGYAGGGITDRRQGYFFR